MYSFVFLFFSFLSFSSFLSSFLSLSFWGSLELIVNSLFSLFIFNVLWGVRLGHTYSIAYITSIHASEYVYYGYIMTANLLFLWCICFFHIFIIIET